MNVADLFNNQNDARVVRFDVTPSVGVSALVLQRGKLWRMFIPTEAWVVLREQAGGERLTEAAVFINAKFLLSATLRGWDFERDGEIEVTTERMRSWFGLDLPEPAVQSLKG